MKKYTVEVVFTASVYVDNIIAETEEEAIKQACSSFSTYGCDDVIANLDESYVVTEEPYIKDNG